MKILQLIIFLMIGCLWTTTQCHALEQEFIEKATKAQKKFSNSIATENWNKVALMLHPLGFNALDRETITKDFIKSKITLHKSGIKLINEEITKSEYFSDGHRHAVFFRMRATYEHPLAPRGKIIENYTLVAISDTGKKWLFPGLNCFSENHMKGLFKNYDGIPAIKEAL